MPVPLACAAGGAAALWLAYAIAVWLEPPVMQAVRTGLGAAIDRLHRRLRPLPA